MQGIAFGQTIRLLRQAKGISLREMARKLGVSPSHLCDIEKGRKVVSPERAARFAKTLGRSPEQFVRLSLQELVDEAGLRMKVKVAAA